MAKEMGKKKAQVIAMMDVLFIYGVKRLGQVCGKQILQEKFVSYTNIRI
jgi:hypothetical protein